MQRLWSAEELGERWTLGVEDLVLLVGLPDTGKLGLDAQLAYWRQNGRFPDEEADPAPAVIGHLAARVGVHAEVLEGYEWSGRTGRRHRRLVLDHLAVAGFDEVAETRFRSWLCEELLPREPAPSALEGEELIEEAVEVRGKTGILFRVAEAAVGSPEGVVREALALGTPQSRRVHTAVRASYGSCYRRMMPKLLAALDFRSNNGAHRPLLDALDAIRRAEGEGRQYFRADEIAIDGVIRPK